MALKFPGFGWWWILLLLASTGILVFSFRQTRAKSSTIIKFLLMLRSLVLLLLLCLLLRPEIHWTSSRRKPPTALIYADNSRSIAEQAGFSPDSLFLTIQEIEKELTEKGIRARLFRFDETIEPIAGKIKSLGYDGLATDLAQVLQYSKTGFERENIIGAIIISDGVITRGEDPAFREIEMPFPVFTIGIGDSNRIQDPAIIKIDVPSTVSAGDTVNIETELIPSGNGEPLTIVLKDGEKIIQKQGIQSQPQALKKSVHFQIVPIEPGEKVLTVEIDADQDRNPYNNLRMATLKVLASQTRILIVSGQANFEARFLSRTLRELKNVNVQNVVENNSQWLPMSFQESNLEKWDLLIFIGYPTAKSNPKDIVSLRQKIINSHLPVVLIFNDRIDPRQVERLLGWNPINEIIVDNSVNQINVLCTREGQEHPVIRNFQTDDLSGTIWSTLPPIGMPFKKIRLASSFQTIIESSDLTENPVMALNQEVLRRTAICVGTDFWRWSFMTQEAGRINVYDELFQGVVKWLTDTLSTGPVQLTINKKIFLTGETIQVSGLVYDLKGLVINDAIVNADLLQKNDVVATTNLAWDGKSYSGSLRIKNAGENRIRISAWRNNLALGIREQTITIIDRPIELLEIRQNADLLQMIALKSGGIKTSDIPEIVSRLHVSEKIIRRSHIMKLLSWRWMLIFLIGLLAIEWGIRRFHGYQ